MELKTFEKGDVIIEKGSYGTSAYVIKSGRVEVVDIINNKVVLAILGEGQIFGEMGLIDDQPRSATVTALEDVQLAVLNRDNFNQLFEKDPKVILPIIKALFERLRTINSMLVSKEGSDTVKAGVNKRVHDSGFITLSGLNVISSDVLDNREMKINKFPFKIGRKHELDEVDVLSDNDLYLQDLPPFNVSRNHFLIDKVEGRYVAVDRGSRLGTIVNGKRIDVQRVLDMGENEIIVGQKVSPFVFKIEIRC
jgi:cAMP-binding proteins - catabolite gene activator and regulatory subunit of cAMP-dependent protein kinases